MKAALRVALVVLTIAYPLVIYFGLQYFDLSYFAFFLVSLAVLRFFSPSDQFGPAWFWTVLLLAVAGMVWYTQQVVGLRIYPLLVNLSMLFIFAHSFFYPPTVIERLAKISEPGLPAEGVIYTRRVTLVWIGFFIFNGTASLVTAFWASMEVWTLYNGLISYLLMGSLLGGERLIRDRVRGKHA
jgi:uncharacterized membrane protein